MQLHNFDIPAFGSFFEGSKGGNVLIKRDNLMGKRIYPQLLVVCLIFSIFSFIFSNIYDIVI